MKKILFVIGTRPEIIKTAPVIAEFRRDRRYRVGVCFTGQHRGMAREIISEFKLSIDYDLHIMKPSQALSYLATESLEKLSRVYARFRPSLVMVQGDTTTALAAALGAFYMKISIAHIEAGLRTYDAFRPYPEEINRTLISRVANLHFAPTEQARQNLLHEGVDRKTIVVTGNTVIDALFFMRERKRPYRQAALKSLPPKRKVILVTAHRRESFGAPLRDICKALELIAKRNSNVIIVYPVHLNPNVREPVRKIIGGIDNIMLIEPLAYPDFVKLMTRAHLILTDSGGVQEEAPSLGKPVLVLRDKTERPEVVRSGNAKVVGTDAKKIVYWSQRLLDSPALYSRMSRKKNPVGDGKAAARIKKKVDALLLQ